jgi:hypothetical protein
MNVVSQLPSWAQGPVRKFIDQAKIEGTQTRPMDADSFQPAFNQAAGPVQLAALDEVPGEDQALGQPGLVKRNGAVIYGEGDSSLSSGNVEAAVIGHRGGREYVTYVQSGRSGFATLRMINDEGSVEVEGSRAQRKSGAIEGYLLSGSFSV